MGDETNYGLLDYRITESINQGRLNEATIGAHGNRINQVENKNENLQRTVEVMERSLQKFGECEKRLDEYDAWRRALLWTFGKLYVASLAVGGIAGFFLSLLWVKK